MFGVKERHLIENQSNIEDKTVSQAFFPNINVWPHKCASKKNFF